MVLGDFHDGTFVMESQENSSNQFQTTVFRGLPETRRIGVATFWIWAPQVSLRHSVRAKMSHTEISVCDTPFAKGVSLSVFPDKNRSNSSGEIDVRLSRSFILMKLIDILRSLANLFSF